MEDFYDLYVDYYIVNGDMPGAMAMMWVRRSKREK